MSPSITQGEEEMIVSLILTKDLPINRIYCLGICKDQKVYESIFLNENVTHGYVSHFYLLVLVNSSAILKTNEIQSVIENVCLPVIPVTALVLGGVYFDRLASAKNVFASRIVEQGKTLYVNEIHHSTVLSDIPEEWDESEAKEWHEFNCKKVCEFMAGAELYRIRENYIMCAFMMHQAAEHALNGIFYKCTGIYIKTHNIEKLLRYCTMVGGEISALFPLGRSEVLQQVRLLQSAYVNARYVKNFSVKEKDIVILREKIRALYVLLQKCTD